MTTRPSMFAEHQRVVVTRYMRLFVASAVSLALVACGDDSSNRSTLDDGDTTYNVGDYVIGVFGSGQLCGLLTPSHSRSAPNADYFAVIGEECENLMHFAADFLDQETGVRLGDESVGTVWQGVDAQWEGEWPWIPGEKGRWFVWDTGGGSNYFGRWGRFSGYIAPVRE